MQSRDAFKELDTLLQHVTYSVAGSTTLLDNLELLKAARDRLKELEYAEQKQKDICNMYRLLQERVVELSLQTFRNFGDDEYWIHMEHDENHPESLVCPVVMSADEYRELMSCRDKLREIQCMIK